MPESPRRVDLRLTISPGSPYQELAAEVARKFAEYAGAPASRIDDVVASVRAALNGTGRPVSTLVTIALEAADGDVVVTIT
jgi:hypothetical protein